MTNVFSIVNFSLSADENNKQFTKSSLQKAVSKTAWQILNEINCFKYENYVPSNYDTPFDKQSVIVIVRSNDGLVLDKFGRHFGYNEWIALKEICRKFLKRGRRPEEFVLLFMTEADYKTARKADDNTGRLFFDIGACK